MPMRLERRSADQLKRLKSRGKKAWDTRNLYNGIFDDLYKYVMPYRIAGIHKKTPGQKLTNELFDATGLHATTSFVGRMQQEVTPPFQDFFSLTAGPLLKRQVNDHKQLEEDLQEMSTQVNAALSTSNFSSASAEMYFDFFAGTGAMLMLEGDARSIIRNVAVPAGELAMELGPWGEIWGRYWTKTYSAWMLEEEWPDAEFSDELKQQIRQEQDKPIEIEQATVWNSKTQLWELCVYRKSGADGGQGVPGEEAEIWNEGYRKSPWITPRFYAVPGEPLGRGPGMLMLPFVKTLNKTRELELQAAAMALFGVWTAVDDSVFNPNTARFKPGTFWKVASNGGSRGPSLNKLDVPGRFDLSRFVTQEEREQINKVGFNRQLPPDTGAVRSPTEIMARIKDLDIDLGGVYGRVANEIIFPIAERGADILASKGILETRLTIDQLSVGLKVLSPIANSQKAAKAKTRVDYMQIVASLFGREGLAAAVRLNKSVPELARDMGVSEEEIPTAEEAKAIQEQIVQQAAAIVAKEQLKASAGAPQEMPINGAAMQ